MLVNERERESVGVMSANERAEDQGAQNTVMRAHIKVVNE